MGIIVVPKRKMLPLQEDTVQPKPVDVSSFITPATLDEILDGYKFGRVNIGYLTVGQINLDDVLEGTYGLVLTTDISAGHIKLSESVGDLDDIGDGGTYQRVLATQISAGKIHLSVDTSFAANYDPSAALTAAQAAQATADGKIVTFYQATAPTAEGTGDLWLDTDDDRLYRWSGSAWVEIQDVDIATAVANAATAQTTADGKIVTFYQDAAPTAEGTGDLWVDTNDGNKLYRWSGSAWVEVPPELANASKTGEWYNASGVEIDATHGINIYGAANALTTRATKTGTIQCYVGVDGKIYAGAGTVILDASGITLKGDVIFLQDANGVLRGHIYASTTELLITSATGATPIRITLLGDLIVAGPANSDLRPSTADLMDLGNNTQYWGDLHIKYIVGQGSGGYIDFSNQDFIHLPLRTSHPNASDGRMYYNTASDEVIVYCDGAWYKLDKTAA